MGRLPDRSVKLHVVTKSDDGVGAPYVIGVFTNRVMAENACKGVGRFIIHDLDPNRVYPRGTLLDCTLIDNITSGSVAARP
jgi:hypothetical protein